jgi:adenylate kinase family enzyme
MPATTTPARHIHILGASGSGTTTLGRALANAARCSHYDTDDIFWTETDPPYTCKRRTDERVALLRRLIRQSPGGWVVSGWLGGWGDLIVPECDLVIFLIAPTEVRLERIRQRETDRFGRDALAPGGRMHEAHTAFLAWAATYDDGDGSSGRTCAAQEAWLRQLACPILRLDGSLGTGELMALLAPWVQKSLQNVTEVSNRSLDHEMDSP